MGQDQRLGQIKGEKNERDSYWQPAFQANIRYSTSSDFITQGRVYISSVRDLVPQGQDLISRVRDLIPQGRVYISQGNLYTSTNFCLKLETKARDHKFIIR